MVFKRFYPNEYVNSTYEIDFQRYYKMGYRGLIFDIDNTLVPHGAKADESIIALFLSLKKMGYNICLLSNNKQDRVEKFNHKLDVNMIYDSRKPSVKNYIRATKLNGTHRANTIFIGDQIFTDIFGANRCGIYSILVKPIHPKEEIQIVLKRFLEKPVIWEYQKAMARQKRVKGLFL